MTLQIGDSVGDFTFLRSDGSSVTLSAFADKALVLIFLRHLTWIPCQAHLVEVRDRYQDIRQAGGDVLVISFTPPPFLALYLCDHPLPFPLLSDPPRSAYHAFGLERTTWRTLLRPGIAARILRLMWRGWRVRRPRKGDDVLQTGGDFVLDARRRLVYAHRSADPTDRPPVEKLLDVLASKR